MNPYREYMIKQAGWFSGPRPVPIPRIFTKKQVTAQIKDQDKQMAKIRASREAPTPPTPSTPPTPGQAPGRTWDKQIERGANWLERFAQSTKPVPRSRNKRNWGLGHTALLSTGLLGGGVAIGAGEALKNDNAYQGPMI